MRKILNEMIEKKIIPTIKDSCNIENYEMDEHNSVE